MTHKHFPAWLVPVMLGISFAEAGFGQLGMQQMANPSGGSSSAATSQKRPDAAMQSSGLTVVPEDFAKALVELIDWDLYG